MTMRYDNAAEPIVFHRSGGPAARAPVALPPRAAPLSGSMQALAKRLRGQVAKAVHDYAMIEPGDKVMVCLSGGADSYTLLDALRHLQRVAPIEFSIVAVNLDQKQPGFPEEVLPRYLDGIGVDYRIVQKDTYSIVKEKVAPGKTTCSLCSRLRRGILYRTAAELGATKLALGHHREDILETLLLNMFFGAKLKTMPPKLRSDDGQHVVIRPLAYCPEKDIKKYAAAMQFPIIPCNLCGAQPNLQRQAMKAMLTQWDQAHPERLQNMFTALAHIVPSHLLDRNLFDFRAFQAHPEGTGDILFDDEASSGPPATPLRGETP